MWGITAHIVAMVIEALGVVKKGIEKEIGKIPGNINLTELQKIALLGSRPVKSAINKVEVKTMASHLSQRTWI